MTDWRKNHRAESNVYQKQWRKKNKAKVRAWRHKNYRDHKDTVRESERRYRAKLRKDVFDAYGHACVLCGKTTDLTIDHVFGDGNAERKKIRRNGGWKFYAWLRQQGFPQERYRVLCRRCNWREWARSKGKKVKTRMCPKCGHEW